MTIGLQGFFTIKIRQPCGTIRREYRFPNLILDNGLNGIGTNGTSWVTAIALGTDSTPPNASQTGLISLGVSTTTNNSSTTGFVAGPPPYSWIRYSKRFAQGVATGTWTEVGIGRSGTNLWSRSLILDGGGSPLPITVLAIEIVDIEYELRTYLSIVDVTGTRTISDIDYDYIVRPSGLTSYNSHASDSLVSGGWMSAGAHTYIMGGDGSIGAYNAFGVTGNTTGQFYKAPTVAAYVSGSYTKTITYSFTISECNTTTNLLKSFLFYFMNVSSSSFWSYCCQFTPSIPKDNTKTLSLTFSQTWARRP